MCSCVSYWKLKGYNNVIADSSVGKTVLLYSQRIEDVIRLNLH